MIFEQSLKGFLTKKCWLIFVIWQLVPYGHSEEKKEETVIITLKTKPHLKILVSLMQY